jgi:hypothetical protein
LFDAVFPLACGRTICGIFLIDQLNRPPSPCVTRADITNGANAIVFGHPPQYINRHPSVERPIGAAHDVNVPSFGNLGRLRHKIVTICF